MYIHALLNKLQTELQQAAVQPEMRGCTFCCTHVCKIGLYSSHARLIYVLTEIIVM